VGILARTWKLYRAGFDVLGADVEILWFPVMSAAAAIAVAACFFLPAYQTGMLTEPGLRRTPWELLALIFAYLYCLYAVLIFFTRISIFSNSLRTL
jgi:hypothetical protein